jgi:hypothetical protein
MIISVFLFRINVGIMEKVVCGYMGKVPITLKLPLSRSSPAVPKASVNPSSASVSEEARVKVQAASGQSSLSLVSGSYCASSRLSNFMFVGIRI